MARPIRNTDPACHNRNRVASLLAFTLAESLVASVVLAFSVVAVSGAIIASQQQTSSQEHDLVAISLARELIEDIASRPLILPDGTPGWPTVTDRSLYDAINDYSGYTDTVTSSILRSSSLTATGTFTSGRVPAVAVVLSPPAALGSEQYLRSVSVTYPTSIFGKTVSSGDFAVVTVTITSATGSTVQLSRIVAKVSVTR